MRIFSLAVTLGVFGCCLLALTVVDLSPRVESDFFFSTDDPELQASRRIGEMFPAGDQLLISATGPDLYSEAYVRQIRELSDELKDLPGVGSVQSLTHGPGSPEAVPESPLWSRLLLGSSPNLSQILVFLDAESAPPPLRQIEEILEQRHRASFVLNMSGVPYVIELVRRSLDRDLRRFSLAALLIFGLAISLIYRSPVVVLGTLLTCLGACAVTLVILALMGSTIGLLTANIITIVFVLTLSHIVFLTASYRHTGELQEALSRTFQGSLWCMTTTLLGFAGLLMASAKPLRELGLAGTVGTAVALVVAYGVYPLFLGRARLPRTGSERPMNGTGAAAGRRLGPVITALVVALALLAAPGLLRLDTDPNLLSYFAQGSELRQGLERIDRNAGSTPLSIVVSDPQGGRLDSDEAQKAMIALQTAIEADPEVGVSLSLPVLLAEAKRAPMAFLLNWRQLVDVLQTPAFHGVASGFITEDRLQSRYFLRMREAERQSPRTEVVSRLSDLPRRHGLKTELVGGLYPLQADLGRLVSGSVFRSLGGLMILFALVASVVARSARTAGSMIFCLALIPVLLLGAVGWWGAPVDVISSPAANVAIALGIDSMIHLVAAVRRRKREGATSEAAWAGAVAQLTPAIAGAAAILAAGFGIFIMSSFPPTARFGAVVAFGTLIAAVMALWVLPFLAGRTPPGAA